MTVFGLDPETRLKVDFEILRGPETKKRLGSDRPMSRFQCDQIDRIIGSHWATFWATLYMVLGNF